ncbi:MAG: HemK family protein methyltransferase [Pseudomonadota bacterium]
MKFTIIEQGSKILSKFNICNAFQESLIIYEYVNKYFKTFNKKSFFKLIYKRTKHIPLAYLTYNQHFYNLKLHILDTVLIPRNDTETIISTITKHFNKTNQYNILDIGVGSGAILTQLLYHFHNSTGTGIDISLHAIRNTYINLFKYNLNANLKLIDINDLPAEKLLEYNIIVSNPPYIHENEKKHMNIETSYEPKNALFCKNYDIYITIFNKLNSINWFQKKNNMLFLEISPFNKDYLYKLYNSRWQVEIIHDMSNNARVLRVFNKT